MRRVGLRPAADLVGGASEGRTKGARHPYPPSTPLIPFSESTAAELPRCFRILVDYAVVGE